MSTPGTSKFDAARIAMLARLEFTPADLAKIQGELEQIVGYVEQLSELDVTGIEPTAHGTPRVNVVREDNAGTNYTRETMLSNSPATIDDELVRVPQVLPGEGMA